MPRTSHRSGSMSGYSSKPPWTVARCNRLLRPLVAKIHVVQKSMIDNTAPDPGPLPPLDGLLIQAHASDTEDSDQSQDWSYKAPQRNPKRRYRVRPQGRATTPPSHDQHSIPASDLTSITLPTPLLQRALSQPHEPIPTPVNERKWDNPTQWRMANTMLQGLTVESMCRFLDNIFQATSQDTCTGDSPQQQPQQQPQHRRIGTRSLVKTCLRQVPQYIVEEENFLDSQGLETRADVTAEVFETLEEFDMRTGSSNECLKQAVRAYAVHLICDLVSEANMSGSIVFTILTTLTRQGAHDEAQAVLKTFVLSRPALHGLKVEQLRISAETFGCLELLKEFGEVTGRFGFVFDTVRELIVARKLPVARAGSFNLAALLNKAVHSIASLDSQHMRALKLLETAFQAASALSNDTTCLDSQSDPGRMGNGQRNSQQRTLQMPRNDKNAPLSVALRTTVSSLCDTICSLAFLAIKSGENSGSAYYEMAILRPIRTAAMMIRREISCANRSDRHSAGMTIVPAVLILTADLICLPHVSGQNEVILRLEALQRLLENCTNDITSRTTKSAVSHALISSSSCCARASDLIEDDAYNFFAYHFESAGNLIGLSTRARQFADEIRQESYRKFWAPANGKVPGSTQLNETPSSERFAPSSVPSSINRPATGYRWEDGLCEWVAATPALCPDPAEAAAIESSPLKRKASATNYLPAWSSSPVALRSTAFSDAENGIDETCITEPSPRARPLLKRRASMILSGDEEEHDGQHDVDEEHDEEAEEGDDEEDELSLITPAKLRNAAPVYRNFMTASRDRARETGSGNRASNTLALREAKRAKRM